MAGLYEEWASDMTSAVSGVATAAVVMGVSVRSHTVLSVGSAELMVAAVYSAPWIIRPAVVLRLGECCSPDAGRRLHDS